MIVTGGQGLARRNKGDGPGALSADAFQHGEVVARADAEVTRNDFAFAFVRENPGEESAAFVSAEAFFAQRQGHGKRRGAGALMRMPSVCTTVSAFPISQVGLPFQGRGEYFIAGSPYSRTVILLGSLVWNSRIITAREQFLMPQGSNH